MLVLSRKRDEQVTCVLPDGRELSVTVVDIRGDKVRLGFTAPADVAVNRHEVHADIQAGVPHAKSAAVGCRQIAPRCEVPVAAAV